MIDVGAVHHHAAEDGEFRDRRPDAGEVVSKTPAVERDGFERAAPHGRPLMLLLVVRMGGVGAKLDVAVGFQRRDGFRTAVEERLAQRGW